jgi:hypothetical protein
MRFALPLILLFAANTAFAHVGHFGDLAGHDHWVAAGALGLAGLVAVWGALKGKKEEPKSEEPETDEQAEA